MSNQGEAVAPGRRKEPVRFTRRQRVGHVCEWEASGMSVAEYGRRHGIEPRNLYRWRDRIWARRHERQLPSDAGLPESGEWRGVGPAVTLAVEEAGPGAASEAERFVSFAAQQRGGVLSLQEIAQGEDERAGEPVKQERPVQPAPVGKAGFACREESLPVGGGLRVVMRRDGLELELSGADPGALAVLAGALRREVLYV
jgi:transposase-like protein